MFIETFNRIFVTFNIQCVIQNLMDILELVLWLLKCFQMAKETQGAKWPVPKLNRTRPRIEVPYWNFHYGSNQNSINVW